MVENLAGGPRQMFLFETESLEIIVLPGGNLGGRRPLTVAIG